MPIHITCMMSVICNINESWIIIFSTLKFNPSNISCQYINKHILTRFSHNQHVIHFFFAITHKNNFGTEHVISMFNPKVLELNSTATHGPKHSMSLNGS